MTITGASNYIRQLREAVGEARGTKCTQAAFAKELGVSVSLINALETKTSRPISNDLDRRLVMNYGVSVLRALYVDENREAIVKANKAIEEANLTDAYGPQHLLDGLRCNADPHAPLVDALKRFFQQREVMESAALGAFDIESVRELRSILLAAKKSGRASAFFQMLRKLYRDVAKELEIPADDILAATEQLRLSNWKFPASEKRTDSNTLAFFYHRILETQFHRQYSNDSSREYYDSLLEKQRKHEEKRASTKSKEFR